MKTTLSVVSSDCCGTIKARLVESDSSEPLHEQRVTIDIGRTTLFIRRGAIPALIGALAPLAASAPAELPEPQSIRHDKQEEVQA